jgi:hypothetical protein
MSIRNLDKQTRCGLPVWPEVASLPHPSDLAAVVCHEVPAGTAIYQSVEYRSSSAKR